jgi:predicted Zn-dependent protease
MKRRKTNNIAKRFYKIGIAAFLMVCLAVHGFPLQRVAFALSIDEEKKLGREFMLKIQERYEFVQDAFVNEYMNELGQYLIRPLETKHFPYRFYVINENELNAFAAPGGHIVFFTGLIDMMEEVDELAGILCHEIAHISARHLSHRIEQSKKIGLATMAGVLAAILLGGKAASALMAGAVGAGAQAQLHFSRNDERQADQLGFKYIEAAGYNPKGMINMFKKLERISLVRGMNIPPYLLTHPAGTERMSNLDSMLQSHTPQPTKPETERFRKDFPYFKTVLKAKYADPQQAETFFREQIEKDPMSPTAHLGLGVCYMERSEYPEAVRQLKEAVMMEPDSLPILTYLSEAYQYTGRDRDAAGILESAHRIDPDNKTVMYLLGVSYLNLEDYPKAVRQLEKLASMPPVRREVYYHLGVAYGKGGRLGYAHYNLGLYFKKMGKMDKARFHFETAESKAGQDPLLRERLKKELKEDSDE